jgi:quercetin dioxygenase-like cupin family protein
VTVFFGDDVSPHAPGGPEFLRSLEAALGAPQGIGAIRTFASAPGGGLEPHYDQGETFIVQLEGTKELRLARNPSHPLLQFIAGKPPVDEHYAEYPHGFPTRAPPDEVVVTLEPGSVLFLPRGMWHRTEASDSGPSYSASICIDTPAPADLLVSALRLYLRQSPLWRRPAYGAWGPQRAAETERLRGLLHDLAERLPTLSAEEILDGGAPFDLCAPSIDEGRRFQRVPTTRLELGKGLRLRAIGHGGREVEIQLNRALLPVANWLKRRAGAFRFDELRTAHPKLARSLLTTLVQSLVAAEALRWLPFDAYDVRTDVVIREVGK